MKIKMLNRKLNMLIGQRQTFSNKHISSILTIRLYKSLNYVCVNVYISETARNLGRFSVTGERSQREPELHAVERCGFVFRCAVHICSVAVSMLGRRVGLGGPIQKGPEKAVLLVPGNKGKRGWFPVWGRIFITPSHKPVVHSGLIIIS